MSVSSQKVQILITVDAAQRFLAKNAVHILQRAVRNFFVALMGEGREVYQGFLTFQNLYFCLSYECKTSHLVMVAFLVCSK